MQHTNTAALIRAVDVPTAAPVDDLPPLDSAPDGGGDTGGGQDDSGDQDGGGGGDGDGGAPGGPAGDGFDPGSLFYDPTPTPREVAPPENAPPGPVPPAERSLDDFPAEIRNYIRGLRDEAADNRVKAKTAAEQFERQREEWVGRLLEATGLISPVADDDEPADPSEQIEQLTGQLAARDEAHKAARLELAIFKGAATAGANPDRLADSRSFMAKVSALDPGADDFESQVTAAIGKAAAADAYYRADPPAGQVPPTPPPVPSGGDFAGGPSGQRTEPQSVDDYRKLLRKSAGGAGSD